MKTKSYLPQRNCYFLIVFFLLLIIQSQITAAQSVVKAQKDFDKLNRAYHAGNVSKDKYLDSAYLLTQQFLNEGTEFKTQELLDLLSLYKTIAWSKKAYGHPRLNYYVALSDNASAFGRTGEAIYYEEKESSVLAENGRVRPLMIDAYKVMPFTEQGLNDKVIAIYNRHKTYIKALPEQLRNKKTENVNGMYAIDILMTALESYIKIKDTSAVYQVALMSDQISNALKRKYPIAPDHMLYNDFYRLSRHHSVALFEHNQAKVGLLLDSMQTVITTYKDQPTTFVEINLFEWKTDYYLAKKNPDSVRFYINKLESLPEFLQSQQPMINEYKAKLQALQGDFHGGYTSITSALAGERKAKTSLMTQMDSLLYAYTDAENSRIDLQQSEAIKKQRTLWLVLISCSAAMAILAIYIIMLYRSGKAKAQVETLNEAANMQIIAMEEAKHQAIREEQQRLGQDLHDGLSSTIAAYRQQIEVLAMDIEDITLKNKFIALRTEMAKTYETVRNKSHEWFSAADEQQEQSFEKQIRLLTDNALPDSRYHKIIQIDDNSLVGVGTDIRIALLRIIQEAVTNIIKHAKAKNIGILIYEEDDNLILTITDDGIGLGEKKTGGKNAILGLESIRRRVQYLDGETDIRSSAKGTEIMVSIPLVVV